MAENKTQKTDASVDDFLEAIDDEAKRSDARKIRDLMVEVTGDRGAMWGEAIVGFGEYTYRHATGREGDWFEVGFSPRKQNLTLYIMSGFDEYDDLLSRLGKHSTGKSCLYIKRLEQVDVDVLRQLVTKSVDHMRAINS